MAKSSTQDIDPRSDETVLYFTGPRPVAGVPARDLHGGDLARIAYVRAHRATEWERRDEAGNAPPRPRQATSRELAKLRDELLETGRYRKTEPDHDSSQASEAATDEPAAPAEG